MAREAALRKMGIDDFTLYTMRKRSQPQEWKINNLHIGTFSFFIKKFVKPLASPFFIESLKSQGALKLDRKKIYLKNFQYYLKFNAFNILREKYA